MIDSSFIVVAGESDLLESWLPSVRPMFGDQDELIVIIGLNLDFQFPKGISCEIILVKFTQFSLRGDWPRMLNFGLRLARKELIYQFDSDKHIIQACKFRETSEELHLRNDNLLVIGPILDHPFPGNDFSEGRKKTLDYANCWGGNVSFLRKNMVFYDERFTNWGGSDREWAFRMVHERKCRVAWNEQAKVRHVPHKLQVDHDTEKSHKNDLLIEQLNRETLERLDLENLQ